MVVGRKLERDALNWLESFLALACNARRVARME
jgi:hypothetical protein